MYFKEKTIKGRKYKYAVKSVRLIDGKKISLEKIYKGEKKQDLEQFFKQKETEENIKYSLKKYSKDHIIDENEIKKIEEIRLNYRRVIKKIPKNSLRDLWDRFTANFTYESNALEGNSLTLKDVVIVMFENSSIKGKDLREIFETRNSRKVVELIINKKLDVSHEDIIKMHKLLVKDLDIQTGYKKIPNIILGRQIETTLPEKVYDEMTSLINWYNENKDTMHPIKLASIFHGKFEHIHPFEDGNGRVGRFLINVILIKNKYPPLIIRKSQRVSYLKVLESFDHKYQDVLIRFLLGRIKDTYRKFFEIYVKYV